MDEIYYALWLEFPEEKDEYQMIVELEECLMNNGVRYFFSSMPGLEQNKVLIVHSAHEVKAKEILNQRQIIYIKI